MKKNIFLSVLLLLTINIFGQSLPNYISSQGLVAWYPFTGNPNDISGNGLNGSVTGASLTTDRFGATASAYNFNANNWQWASNGDYIYIPYNAALNFTAFTVSAWIQRSSSGSTLSPQGLAVIRRYQFGYSQPSGQVWTLDVGHGTSAAGPLVYGGVSQQGGPTQNCNSTQSVTVNTWTHLIMMYSNGTLQIYMNGQLAATSTNTNLSINTTGNSGISIGLSLQANGNWAPFDGKIDDIGIWNRLLNPCEINKLYTGSSPSVTINTSSTSLCIGQTASLTASGANSYTWSNTQTGTISVVTPTQSLTYSVTATNSAGCTASSTINLIVHPLPVITAANGTVCSGNSFTILPSGASSYTITGGTYTVSPVSNTTYSIVGTSSAGCVSNTPALSVVSVNSLPVLSVSASSSGVCIGQTATLSVTGANSYTWNNQQTGSITVTSPTINSTYSVVGQSAEGCTATAISGLSVYPNPTISAISASICSGATTTIVPSGASSYTITGGNFTVSPAVTTTYDLTGTSPFGCINVQASIITISVISTPTISAQSGTICAGNAFTLNPAGAINYTFSAGSVVSPTATTAYTITGQNTSACISSPVIATVTVFGRPSVSLTAQSTSICVNDGPVTLIGLPVGGNYTGLNVTGSTFTPSQAGQFQSSYSYTEALTGCASSASISLRVDLCSGLLNITNTNKPRVFPNPSENVFSLINDQHKIEKLQVYNIAGDLISEAQPNSNTYSLDLSAAPAGIYFVIMQSANDKQSVKLIKW